MPSLTKLVEGVRGHQASPEHLIRCHTCQNLGWKRVGREFLDSIIDGSIPLNTGVGKLYRILVGRHADMEPPVKRYTPCHNSLKAHIRNCEYDRWQKVLALRSNEGGS